MPNDPGWYARHFGGGQQTQQAPPQTFYAAPPSYAPATPQQYAPQAPMAPESFAEAIVAVQSGRLPTYGAEATRTETVGCPACGDRNYFSRRKNSVTTARGTASPAPLCYACGYNGLFEQADESTWVSMGQQP